MKRTVRTIELSWEETQKIQINAGRSTSEIITAGSDQNQTAYVQTDDAEVEDIMEDRPMLSRGLGIGDVD